MDCEIDFSIKIENKLRKDEFFYFIYEAFSLYITMYTSKQLLRNKSKILKIKKLYFNKQKFLYWGNKNGFKTDSYFKKKIPTEFIQLSF